MMKTITLLPLVGINTLDLNDGTARMLNGYTIIARDNLGILKEFEIDEIKRRFGSDIWSALYADYFVQVEKQHSITQLSANQLSDEGAKDNSEKLDKLLLAININERIWALEPHMLLSWHEDNGSSIIKTISKRDSHPIPSSSVTPKLEDFEEAAQLTVKINTIYEENESSNSYPALRIAFDSLRLGVLGFSTRIRFLQEAICLETICSTDTTEVTHRISVICALLLASSLEERRILYREIKYLYGIRSSLIHGSASRVTIDDLRRLEQISRKLLRRVLDDDILPRFINRGHQKAFLLETQLTNKLESESCQALTI